MEAEKDSVRDRVRGTLLGLCAGDHNGGPIRMALRLAESLGEHPHYKREDVVERYKRWSLGPPHDTERAFDTGGTFFYVFGQLKKNACSSVDEASEKYRSLNPSAAGINAAHRSAPLAMKHSITNEELPTIASLESKITHAHHLSIQCAVVLTLLCRQLIQGISWENAKQNIIQQSRASVETKTEEKKKESNIFPLSNEVIAAILGNRSKDRGGYAPDVLATAIYYLDHYADFDSCLVESIKYAGAANYSPVLVGALAGARWGVSKIGKTVLAAAKVTSNLVERISLAAEALAKEWEE